MQLRSLFEPATWDKRAEIRALLGDVTRKHVLGYVLAVLGTIYIFTPMYTGMTTAFKTRTGFAETLPIDLPQAGHFTVEPWLVALETLVPAIWNSLLMTLPAMFLSAVLGSVAAYGLTMVDWRGQVALMVTFICAVFIPKQAILVPLSQFWHWVGLEGLLASLGFFSLPFADPKHATLLVLIITHTVKGISVCTVLFRGYYLTINREIIEAARIDGAGIADIYRKIVLPLSMPMFMVAFIFQFTMIYNEFLFALILVRGTSPDIGAVVTLTLNEINSSHAVLFNRQMAGAFIAAIPTIVVYVLFGKQFAKGVQY